MSVFLCFFNFFAMNNLSAKIKECKICKYCIDPKPIVLVNKTSRIIIIGQAPGLKVHQS